MLTNEENLKGISSIYRYLFANGETHRNILRKDLIWEGKIKSKSKFFNMLDALLSSGNLVMEKEVVSCNPKAIRLGVLVKKRDDFYVVTPGDRRYYKINRKIVNGYKNGEILDVVIEQIGDNKEAIVLGKSEKKISLNDAKEKTQAKQVENSDNHQNLVLGRVIKTSHDKLVFIPNNKKIPCRQIPILNEKEDLAAYQDKICVINLVNMEAPLLGGYITEVKGDAGNPIHEYDAIAENYGAIMSWEGVEIESEIQDIPNKVDLSELNLISEEEALINHKNKTVDLRHIPFVTVDPASCKDMDDAIYSTINNNGDIVCYTAVANVPKYVDLDTEIGRRYVEAGFTIYAPNKAYNILPAQLSTGVCSLNPNEDRLAFVVKTVIDKETGEAKESCVFDAVIQSKHKYSYEEAQEIVDSLDTIHTKKYLETKISNKIPLNKNEQVLMNYYAGQTIKSGFERRKMIRFNANNERNIVFDDDFQNVVDIKPVEHLFYHEVIESFMVTANEATAKFAKDYNLKNIYRVHEEPNPRKVARANEFFKVMGINHKGALSVEETRHLLELAKNTVAEETINSFLIKMQSKAEYSNKLFGKQNKNEDSQEEKISHYALQSKHYSHTTSPIRRVPDYVTQYNILAHIHGTAPISGNKIEKIVENSNVRQDEVALAEKDFEDISSVMYCEQHIGEKMKGKIVKIREAGPEEGYDDSIIVIVKNDDTGVNVEIPLSQILGRPSYDCELSEHRCAVYDRNGKTVLTLCKPVNFVIENADRKVMRVTGSTNKELMNGIDHKINRENSDKLISEEQHIAKKQEEQSSYEV